MEEYDGKVKRIFRHFPLPMHAGAEKTHEASECAGEQGKFWEYHAKLFENVGGYRTNDARIELAGTLGLNTDSFKTCLESGRFTELVQKDIAKGASVGVTGTPAAYINGVKVSGARPYPAFKEVVDALLAGKEPAAAQKKSAPPAPTFYEFKDLEGKPAKGPKNAPVTIVEFSDFHCPFCSRVQSSLQQVMNDYGDQVRIVWRHFPLAMHQSAPRAHEASQCAFEQHKFWEFHDLLFENMDKKNDAAYIGHAEKIGLDMAAFKQCLETGKYAEYIKEEVAAGQKAGVRGTPGFFINGKSLRGAQPYDRFKALIDEALKA
jgi:protein-disulfide isomerase